MALERGDRIRRPVRTFDAKRTQTSFITHGWLRRSDGIGGRARRNHLGGGRAWLAFEQVAGIHACFCADRFVPGWSSRSEQGL